MSTNQHVQAVEGRPPRNVARHSVVYFLGSLASFAGGVLMLPVYTHALTPAEYGLLETVLRLVGVCMSVGFVGIRQGFMRLYFDDTGSDRRDTLATTSVVATFLVSFGLILPLSTGAFLLARDFGMARLPAYTSIVFAAWLAFEATFLLGLAALQVRLRSGAFVAAQASRMTMLLLTNFVLLHEMQLGLAGALVGNVAAAVLSGAITAVLLLKNSGHRVSRSAGRELLVFGLPYVPLAALTYVCTNADRFALIYFDAIMYLGLLALAAKLGEMTLSIVVGFMDSMWSPFAYDASRDVDGPARIGRLYTVFIAMCAYLAMSVSLAAPAAVAILASDDFLDAAQLVPIVAFGWIFAVASNLSDVGILIRKKTHLKPLIMAATAVFAVALQILLTPRAGVVGAAVAAALTNVFMFLIVRFVSKRLYPLATNMADFLVITLAGAVAYLAGWLVLGEQDTILRTVAALVIASAIYATTMHATRVLRLGDVMNFLKAARARS